MDLIYDLQTAYKCREENFRFCELEMNHHARIV